MKDGIEYEFLFMGKNSGTASYWYKIYSPPHSGYVTINIRKDWYETAGRKEEKFELTFPEEDLNKIILILQKMSF